MRALCFFLLLATGLRAVTTDFLFAAGTDAELGLLLARLESPRAERRLNWQFWCGTWHGKSIVLTRTEGDPLNAVAATTLGIRHYAPRLVITLGAARAHDPALHPGDLVVSEKFAAFDGLVSSPAPLDSGCAPLTWQSLPHLLATVGERETPLPFFPADSTALARARRLSNPQHQVIVGVLGSAPQVNREVDRINWLRQTWGTSCEDPESAHIAGCAFLLQTPCIGLRVIDGTPGQVAAVALELLEALP